jgi:hypothetical protein
MEHPVDPKVRTFVFFYFEGQSHSLSFDFIANQIIAFMGILNFHLNASFCK